MAKRKATKRKKAPARRKKKTSSRRRKPTTEMLLVGSKVKNAIRGHKVNVASDAAESLNQVVHWYIEQAAKRAAANNRKTVRAHDFMVP